MREGSVLLGEDSRGGLVVEALLFLEHGVGVFWRLVEEGALVLVFLLVDDEAHGGETALVGGGIGDGQGLADALRLEGGTVSDSPREPGCLRGRGRASVGKMSWSWERALSRQLAEDMVYD